VPNFCDNFRATSAPKNWANFPPKNQANCLKDRAHFPVKISGKILGKLLGNLPIFFVSQFFCFVIWKHNWDGESFLLPRKEGKERSSEKDKKAKEKREVRTRRLQDGGFSLLSLLSLFSLFSQFSFFSLFSLFYLFSLFFLFSLFSIFSNPSLSSNHHQNPPTTLCSYLPEATPVPPPSAVTQRQTLTPRLLSTQAPRP
jgi:hypothetical protein